MKIDVDKLDRQAFVALQILNCYHNIQSGSRGAEVCRMNYVDFIEFMDRFMVFLEKERRRFERESTSNPEPKEEAKK
jgi:hypothetical protein